MNRANKDVREAAFRAGVNLWEVAARVGIAEGTFCRKMRFELPDHEKAHILDIIHELQAERLGA